MEPKAASLDVRADDTLEGAAAIAEYLFGSRDLRRKVYYLARRRNCLSSGWAACSVRAGQ